MKNKHAWLIFAIALIFRLIHFHALHSDMTCNVLQLDSLAYDRSALQIFTGEGLPREAYFQAPLYPYFLAGIYSILGHGYDQVRISQMILDSASAAITGFAASQFFGFLPGMTAGLCMSAYPVLIFESGLILKTTLTVFLTSLILLLLSFPRKPGIFRIILLGMATGAGAATQGSVLLQIPVLLLWLIVSEDFRRPFHWLGKTLFFLIGFSLVVAPFSIRNYLVAHEFVLLTSQGGANFYIGNGPYSDGTSKRPPHIRMTPEHEERDFHLEAERLTGRILTKKEASAFWFRQSIDWMKQNPREAAALQLRKFLLFWNRVEIPDNYDFDFYRMFSPVIRYPRYPFVIPGILGVMGMAAALRDWKKLWVLYAMGLSFIFIVTAFHVYSRYRLPVVVYLFPFAGCFFSRMLRWISDRRTSTLAGWAVAATLLFIIGSLPMTHYTWAQSYFNQAVALSKLGKSEQSAVMYQKALQVDPEYAPAMVNLGKHAYSLQDIETAENLWKKAIQMDPSLEEAYSNLGTSAIHQGNLDSAQKFFRKSVEVQPYYFLGWLHLGQLYQMNHDPVQARFCFEEALRIQPGQVQALFGYAKVLDDLSDAEAVRAWQKYVNSASGIKEEEPYIQYAGERISVLASTRGVE